MEFLNLTKYTKFIHRRIDNLYGYRTSADCIAVTGKKLLTILLRVT